MLYIKALHIIFVVTWFAGLFYIVRLFIYHTEAQQSGEPERSILQKQFKLMEKRLWYGIAWPSAILTFIFGFWLLYNYNWWEMPFMHLKLGFVAFLYVYHFLCHFLFMQLQNNILKYSSTQLRVWNEVATLFLVSIVFIIVLKNSTSWIKGLVGLLIFTIVLMLAIKFYKTLRNKNKDAF
jgi:putative membrane protein